MKKTKRIQGKCHLCGKIKTLSLEHVPPQAAFNKSKVSESSGLETIGRKKPHWQIDDIKKKLHQGGIKCLTLCENCNSETGSWYGGHYLNFVRAAIKDVRSKGNKLTNNQTVRIDLKNINPIRTIKQIIAMFFSINHDTFAECHPELQKYVLDKNKCLIDASIYNIGIYILSGEIGRRIGLTGMINNYVKQQRMVSELACPPFGFVLEINRPLNANVPYCDITHFANSFERELNQNIVLEIPVLESNTTFLFDFRSKESILNKGEMSNEWTYLAHDKYYSYFKLDDKVLIFTK